ncbi:MAG TPA: DNRLRE domain-containing protein, partial [Bacteroidales bacterium]
MKLRLLIFTLSVVLTGILSAQTTISITPTDALVEMVQSPSYAYLQTTNYGGSTAFYANNWTTSGSLLFMRSYLKINLSSLPCGAVISQANLYLYGDGNHSNTTLNGSGYLSNECWLMRTTSPWEVNTITYDQQPSVTSLNAATLANSTSSSQDYVVNITQLVKDMQNNPSQGNGLLLILKNDPNGKYSRMCFFSSDYSNAAKKPRVDITYTASSLMASAGAAKSICMGTGKGIGGSPTASGGSGTGYTYSWSPSIGLNSTTIANPTASPTTTTTYTVTVTDAGGCGLATSSVVVNVNPLPAIYNLTTSNICVDNTNTNTISVLKYVGLD